MKAVGLYKYLDIDDSESLLDIDIEKPKAYGKDLLVRVKAISVNPVDTKIRSRGNKDIIEKEPKILGWDASGIVEEAGKETSIFKKGDEVYYAGSIIRPGCNCEYHLVDERIVGKKPKSLSFEESAALPLTSLTAWESLFERLLIPIHNKTKNENQSKVLLIINGAGGVGSIAIQLAKAIAGIKVIATSSKAEGIDWCKKMGADYCINHYNRFEEEIKKIGIKEVDYIFCCHRTELHLQNMADVIKPQGKICSIVGTKDGIPLNMNILQQKSITFVWEYMFTKSMFETIDMLSQHNILNYVAKYIDKKTLQTTLREISGQISAVNLKNVHRKIEEGNTIGKIALSGYSNE